MCSARPPCERDEDRRRSKRGIGTKKDGRFFGQRGLPVAFGFPLAAVNLLLLFFLPLFLSLRQTLHRENLSLSLSVSPLFPPMLFCSYCVPPPSPPPPSPSPVFLGPLFVVFRLSLNFFRDGNPRRVIETLRSPPRELRRSSLALFDKRTKRRKKK